MTFEFAVFTLCAFCLLAVGGWKVYCAIDERLFEIEANIRLLHGSTLRLVALAPKEARNSAPVIDRKLAGRSAGKDEPDAPPLSPGLENGIAEVEELCAKLIALVPPAKALPLLSNVPSVQAMTTLPGPQSDRLTKYHGRKLVLSLRAPEYIQLPDIEPTPEAWHSVRR
jgi:hypothetical protein